MRADSLLARRVREVLEPGGIISRRLPGYEAREGQVAMAEEVALAIEGGEHAVIEGSTGVGKSLAYLIPAIYSGKRVVVSTANKALQEQLLTKDIPFLQHVLPRDVTAALVKGRSNYVCLDRLDAEENEGALFPSHTGLQSLRAWVGVTRSGDVDEMENAPARETLMRVTSSSRTCIGTTCLFHRDCFVERVRAAAEEASIIVCNHALLLADLVLRDLGGGLLPDRDLVVIDEAHRLEETATSALTVVLSRRSIDELTESGAFLRHVPDATKPLLKHVDRLFGPFEREASGNRLVIRGELGAAIDLAATLEETTTRLRTHTPYPSSLVTRESRHYDKLIEWIERLAEDARLLSRETDDDSVRYVESARTSGGEEIRLQWAPIAIAEPLGELLFRHTPVICTSATLAVGDFSYFQRSVGIEEARTLQIPSPFNYPEHCLLYVPAHTPTFTAGGSLDYSTALWEEIERLVTASRGRAMVLFTSYRGMDEAFAALSPRLPFTLLKQGTLPRHELLRRFREDRAASTGTVLFATRSFWEGIDIVGEALSLVILDRVPFSVPDDPILAARSAKMKREGLDPFNTLSLPTAILGLKQGFGRLIRSGQDRGVVAILDSRIARRGYGRRILHALPPARLTHDIADVVSFFEG